MSFSGFTIHAYNHFMQGIYPMILSVIDSDGDLTQFRLNPKAKELLTNLIIGKKHILTPKNKKILFLFYDGKQINNC